MRDNERESERMRERERERKREREKEREKEKKEREREKERENEREKERVHAAPVRCGAAGALSVSRVLCLLCPGSLRGRSAEEHLGLRLPARTALTTQGWWPVRWRNLKSALAARGTVNSTRCCAWCATV